MQLLGGHEQRKLARKVLGKLFSGTYAFGFTWTGSFCWLSRPLRSGMTTSIRGQIFKSPIRSWKLCPTLSAPSEPVKIEYQSQVGRRRRVRLILRACDQLYFCAAIIIAIILVNMQRSRKLMHYLHNLLNRNQDNIKSALVCICARKQPLIWSCWYTYTMKELRGIASSDDDALNCCKNQFCMMRSFPNQGSFWYPAMTGFTYINSPAYLGRTLMDIVNSHVNIIYILQCQLCVGYIWFQSISFVIRFTTYSLSLPHTCSLHDLGTRQED